MIFVVATGTRQRFRSRVFRGGEPPETIDLPLHGATEVDLLVEDAGDGPACDRADWAEARLLTQKGATWWLDALPRAAEPPLGRYPFSFHYAGRHSDTLLPQWRNQQTSAALAEGKTRTTTT